MTGKWSRVLTHARWVLPALAVGAGAAGVAAPALADDGHELIPGNLLVSRSVYDGKAPLVAGATKLPTGCTTECVTANAGAAYPQVFDNDLIDESFGITSKIYLDELTPFGWPIGTIEVPNSGQRGVGAGSDQMVTSFSSKSELALNLSTGDRYVTFMGYLAPVDAIDASNANTPSVIDPTNPDKAVNYRVVAQLDKHGHFHFTETNAYSGNNGRAAILNEEEGQNLLYTAGNAGNGSKPVPPGIITGAGAQLMAPSTLPESAQTPELPTPFAAFNITQLGDKADKPSKDTNFRGLTISGKVVYFTKGSGSNGVNTVYFVDTTGKACPTGVGLPVPGAPLPTNPLAYTEEGLKKEMLSSDNMCILRGFPTELKTKTHFPFGLWFANASTLYVADEGNGENAFSSTLGDYNEAATDTEAGLQKWVFEPAAGEWKHVYTLQAGLDLGQPYAVPGYPTGENPLTKLPWAPSTGGLRNLTGRLDSHGLATIWAVTSTVSGDGDQGADPNKLVAISDPLAGDEAQPWQRFLTLRHAGYGEVLRGVSFTPGTPMHREGR
ncbi:MAG TPA: hypothetical protein VFR48_08060 [Solirubrobacteraceae bacterium]|nr:hypothetical protein [Solirubrobacteraceae bacterium]